MTWIEEEKGVKFLCWGKLKEGLKKEETIVVKEGEHIEGIITRITPQKEKDEIKNYQYRLKKKDEDKEIIIWGNAAIFRQHHNLNLVEGDKVRFSFDGMYPTEKGNKGYKVRVAVDR